ncbi:MAG: glutamate-5-semialdehyde dehydrogenase [Dehalococcoidia bacterium]
MTAIASELEHKGAAAKAASRKLATLATAVKDQALLAIADAMVARQDEIIAANEADIADARADGLGEHLIERMLLTPARIAGMANDVRSVAALPDPVGEEFDVRRLPNGLQIGRRRVPLGVIGTIYESRPNVTIDIASLCLKSGNAVILRGGKEAIRSNAMLAGILRDAIASAGVPAGAIQFIENTDRALVSEMLRMRGTIDLMVPRGSADLIRRVYAEAAMAVVAGGIGVCHTYVDATAKLEMARDIVVNAKCRRYSICNALDTLLVDRAVAETHLPPIARALIEHDVELRCEPEAAGVLAAAGVPHQAAAAEDFGMEFLALVAAVKVVDGLDGALAHITEYGSGHSEAIVTEDYSHAQRFLDEVDAAAVFVNASTQFTDGAQFGLGAEVGISTQKMHARGPIGLRELTSYKWVIYGEGQIRPV